MTNLILLILLTAAEGFLLFCLFHFGQELKQIAQREAHADVWVAVPNLNIMSIAVWREVSWGVGFDRDDLSSPTGKAALSPQRLLLEVCTR